jgi:hypothetical protein
MAEEAVGEPEGDSALYPLRGIVPQRAVLTELARGFLLAHESDPGQARRFAASFLRERSGTPTPGRVVPPRSVPSVRRGVTEALRDV